VPLDTDNDGIADTWERAAVGQWENQYRERVQPANVLSWFDPLDAFGSPMDDEQADPDGPGPLVAQKTEGDHIPVFDEYRGFILNGGGFDGTKMKSTGGHLRLSPARKEALIEVDSMRDTTLDGLWCAPRKRVQVL
jgi:hypothetical protein